VKDKSFHFALLLFCSFADNEKGIKIILNFLSALADKNDTGQFLSAKADKK
jgi:hypothetical protein